MENKEQMTLVEYLEKEAFKRNMSISKLCRNIGLSHNYTHQLKKLKKYPTTLSYYKIADYLDIDLHTLRNMKIN